MRAVVLHDVDRGPAVEPVDVESPRAGEAYRQRPDEVRMLVSCLKEQGYKIVPWQPL